MKSVVSKVDRALKRLYNLEPELRAEDFLITEPPSGQSTQTNHGALYLHPPTDAEPYLNMGIYLNPESVSALGESHRIELRGVPQIAAFGVVAEEVSHFHYIAHHAPQGRGVSHLELELQGEVDKFLLCYFIQLAERVEEARRTFEQLLETLFVRVSYLENLSTEQRARYEQASRTARAFLVKHAELAVDRNPEKFLKTLRAFYRGSLDEKISRSSP